MQAVRWLICRPCSRFGGYTENNAYDSAGNPTTFRGNSRTYNTNNQVTSTNLSSSFTYDGNGNPTTYGGKAATYDEENRLTAYPNGSNTWGAGYRADGLRAWTRTSATGAKTYYYYDQGNAVLEMKSNGTILSTNVFAPDGLVSRLSWLTTSGGGTASCWGDYLFDWQGNAVHCLFSGGNLIEDGEPLVHAAYNAWGQRNFVYNNGAWPDLLRFGYNARWGYKLDTETGLYYCQHRYYDPANGRWVTRDPIGFDGGLNLYGYCAGAPILQMDQYGKKSVAEYYDDVREWFSGTDVLDGNGNPVRIGGWPALLNLGGNAMTLNGTVHLNDYDDYQEYINREKWQDHEERHLQQADEYAGGSAIVFCVSMFGQYVGTGSHDNSPFEREADVYAGRKYRNPLGAPWLGDPMIDIDPSGEYPDLFGPGA